MTLEVRLPISPQPTWLNRTRLIVASIREIYPDTIIRVYIGQPHGPTEAAVRLCDAALKGFGIEWIGRREFDEWQGTRSEYLATMMRRYRAPFDGDFLLFLDADVICLKGFDELFARHAIIGVQAHHSPHGVAGWQRIFAAYGLPSPRLDHGYSGFGAMFNSEAERYGPFYPNSGMVFGPRSLFEALADPFAEAIRFLKRTMTDSYWFDQVGFAMGVAQAALPVFSLPPRYNFPNRPAFERAMPEEMKECTFLHFMQTDVVDRDHDFASSEALDVFCAREDLQGTNEMLRRRVAHLRQAAGV